MKFDLPLINDLLVDFTNEARSRSNLKPLIKSDILHNVATIHSSLMITFNFFSHKNIFNPYFYSPITRVSLVSGHTTFKSVGENIMLLPFSSVYSSSSNFINPSSRDSCNVIAKYILNGFMNSEGHRKNILSSDYEFVGCSAINFIKGTNSHYFMITQNLGRLL